MGYTCAPPLYHYTALPVTHYGERMVCFVAKLQKSYCKGTKNN